MEAADDWVKRRVAGQGGVLGGVRKRGEGNGNTKNKSTEGSIREHADRVIPFSFPSFLSPFHFALLVACLLACPSSFLSPCLIDCLVIPPLLSPSPTLLLLPTRFHFRFSLAHSHYCRRC